MQSDFFQQTGKVLTVGELTRAIRGTLESRFGSVWVQGEVSNYKAHSSGHQYFTLKDHRAQIACVIFRNTLAPSAPPLADGAQIQIFGQISVFEARGQYQLSAQIVQTRGLGLLQAKFEALKRKLEAEGIFETARKRSLPRFPRRVGIVTSANGAAIRDMLNVLRRRAPALEILISPVRVQGTGAAAEIAVALRELTLPNECWRPLDLVVLTRGGGSIEDLWEFNEEIVARAIFDSSIPIVSAVGHEIDFTIADFAADLRAPTPSAAAELIVPDSVEVLRRVEACAMNLQRSLRNFLANHQTRLRFLSERALARELVGRIREVAQQVDLAKEAIARASRQVLLEGRSRLTNQTRMLLAHNPARELGARRDRLTRLQSRLAASSASLVSAAKQRFVRAQGLVEVLGPAATLRRGYSVTTAANGTLIRSVSEVARKQKIQTRVSDGKFDSEAC